MTDATEDAGTTEGIRPALAADVPAVRAVTDAAYHHYIARIGVVPKPMEADHADDVAAGRVFVSGEPVNGLVVVEAFEDHLFLDSIAVHPGAHGRGMGRRLLALMWENRTIYPKYGYEVVERRVDGPYDRVHHRKRLG
jgi:ribosomal protein S18 acetylase RimI-like enzyme